ncbi:MAG: DNA-processing protein DprA [Candidatus Nanopelagicales bacterium]|jgi:DNA processing protein|nr:DNA-processing protein DprA [Candidatus Nanopelagicales bacterium]MDP4715400.1 DNA-processing protein DprA [Candidatus Nanopelagicales bacterium]MDP4905842.1 DNA-processing protein DprA [Candidatus Nanopelagicales bacterium]MDP4975356.1 DNA-processing protein DprA [Candidatus Nanopelagicales bacterium]
MGGVMDDSQARVLLGLWFEAGDRALGSRVATHTAITVVEEILAGRSPLAEAARPRMQAQPNVEEHLTKVWTAAERVGARFVVPGGSEWPRQLDDLGLEAPLGLWVCGAGDMRLLALRSVAIVGARAATAYGESVARELGAHLSDGGWLTVSGGAFGIDAAAHRGALAAGGATACVLAGGVDVPYPRSHVELLAVIRERGVLISETPLGGAAMRHRFLTRNRIIAALSRGTVVVEAAVRSGGLTTARRARDLRRVVMAVPGPVTSPMSAGCHRLIREGDALITCSPREVTALMTGQISMEAESDPHAGSGADALGWREKRILDAVPVRRSAPLANLARVAGIGTTEAMVALGTLDALGLIRREGQGWVRASASQ